MSEIQSPTHVKWLVMLYLSGDNNLSPDMVWAINEISQSGVPDDFAVTIQYDALTPGAPTVRYQIDEKTKLELGAGPGPIPFPNAFAGQLEEDDAADPDVLAAFMRWSIQRYTAQYRMLILSGHGDGMLGDFLTDEQAKTSEPGSMSIKGLRKAIDSARQPYSDASTATSSQELEVLDPVLHVLGMDSCLMSTLEVAAELAGEHGSPRLVRYLVASEGLVPLSGWPYGYLLEMAKERKESDSEPVARALVEDCAAYYRSYLPAGISFDIAACDLAAVPPIMLRSRDTHHGVEAAEREQGAAGRPRPRPLAGSVVQVGAVRRSRRLLRAARLAARTEAQGHSRCVPRCPGKHSTRRAHPPACRDRFPICTGAFGVLSLEHPPI